MQQIRSTPSASRKRTTLSAEERTSFAFACEGSESIDSTSGLSISHGWMWTWTSNTRMGALCGAGAPRCRLSVGCGAARRSSMYYKPHSDGCLGPRTLKLGRCQKLRVNVLEQCREAAAKYGRGSRAKRAYPGRGDFTVVPRQRHGMIHCRCRGR